MEEIVKTLETEKTSLLNQLEERLDEINLLKEKLLSTQESLNTIVDQLLGDHNQEMQRKDEETNSLKTRFSEVVNSLEDLNRAMNTKLLVKKISPKIEKISEHQDKKLGIGGWWTHIAVKDEQSFMIGSGSGSIKLIEKGKIFFSGRLPKRLASLADIFYCRDLNCYFLYYDFKIYIKRIDPYLPTFFLDLFITGRLGNIFVYSPLNHRLIISQNHSPGYGLEFQSVSVINLFFKKRELRIKNPKERYMMGYALCGKDEDRLAMATVKGYILLFDLYLKLAKDDPISEYKVNLYRERILSIAADPKGEYLFLGITTERTESLARTVVVKVNRSSAEIEGVIGSVDFERLNFGEIFACACLGDFGNWVKFVGLSGKVSGKVLAFSLNSVSEEFRWEKDEVLEHQELNPARIHRVEESFYYTGWERKVMKLSLTL